MRVPSAVMLFLVAGLALAKTAHALGWEDDAQPNVLGDSALDLTFTPVNPCRIIDTRGGGGALGAGSSRDFHITGTVGFEAQGGNAGGCGVPAGATAAVVNFVAVNPAGAGNLRAWPFGQTEPASSIINFRAGVNIANGLVVALCDPAATTCGFDLTVRANVSAADLVADVMGYFKLPANFVGTPGNQMFELKLNDVQVMRIWSAAAAGTERGANVVLGSDGNILQEGVQGGMLAGGGVAFGVAEPNQVTGHFGTVSGGAGNRAGDTDGNPSTGIFDTVGGGYHNTASGEQSTIAGGNGNTASNTSSTIGGGESNTASNGAATVAGGAANTAEGAFSTVGGGGVNAASGYSSTVAGGSFNAADGDNAVVPGGSSNQAGGSYSFAAGYRSKVRNASQSGVAGGDKGTFVWADSTNADFQSTGPNQFLIRVGGGVGINTTAPVGELQLGSSSDTTAFRFGNAGTRNHLITNRDMVFDAFGNVASLFIWRRNTSKFDESAFINLMTLSSAGDLRVNGNLEVIGDLSKGGGSFKIDHPLDPRNKYLFHSFVESPDMKNIYDGVVTTDADGFATIELPRWFEALNRDFRYQLTVIDDGDDWVTAKIVRRVAQNRFTLRTSRGGVEVSWQVTGIRKDAFAETHRIPVEQDKSENERGRCLHAEACGERN